jgi:hypothetical protein
MRVCDRDQRVPVVAIVDISVPEKNGAAQFPGGITKEVCQGCLNDLMAFFESTESHNEPHNDTKPGPKQGKNSTAKKVIKAVMKLSDNVNRNFGDWMYGYGDERRKGR